MVFESWMDASELDAAPDASAVIRVSPSFGPPGDFDGAELRVLWGCATLSTPILSGRLALGPDGRMK